jgi:2'-5' RNA ligase
MQAAFVILLDPPSYNYVRNIQNKIYGLFGAKETLKLEPHFTLKYAFEINDLDAVEDYFDELVGRTKELEVSLNNIGTFENEKNVVFLNVEKNETLTKLHLKVLEDLSQRFSIEPGEFEGEGLHFHITLAYKDISNEVFRKIKDLLKEEQPNIKFKIKRLGLYLFPDSDTGWFIYKIGNLV